MYGLKSVFVGNKGNRRSHKVSRRIPKKHLRARVRYTLYMDTQCINEDGIVRNHRYAW